MQLQQQSLADILIGRNLCFLVVNSGMQQNFTPKNLSNVLSFPGENWLYPLTQLSIAVAAQVTIKEERYPWAASRDSLGKNGFCILCGRFYSDTPKNGSKFNTNFETFEIV